ncbi:uncharacterized protein [Watersipora subatra]|uniref:uncharacterized protein n=1 Tax=Watersipora subatra TaxID=2589382 RepID=UPI00355C62CB
MDDYEQIRHLADGGFGKAYLYERKTDRAQFVIKVVNIAMFSPSDTVESMREVKVLKKLTHPNIVKFENAFKDGSNICIVMEYCEAGDLHTRITSGEDISERQNWDWFVQMCKALQYMHSSKVIHRDLKPSNVFISQDGTLRIGDFGLAKVFLHSGQLQNSSSAGFTVGYGAPEMLEDLPFTDKCDVWSLGCVFYFMIMKVPPFHGKSAGHILRKVLDGTYDPIPATHGDSMVDMIDRLLTKDPEQRPTISEVLAIDYVKNYARPSTMLQSVYGHAITDGVLRDGDGNGYVWSRYLNNRDNNNRFAGIAEILTEDLFGKMLELGLKKLPVPLRPNVDPDYNNPGTIIFATPDWKVCEQLLILIHGSGQVKAGQWAQRIMMTGTLETGTQLPYIREALDLGYGIIVLNTNDNRPDIEGCKSPENHGLYVWENYVKESRAHRIAIKAHSAGGYVTTALYKKYPEDFKRRVFANAFTGVDPVGVPLEQYTKKVTRNWVTSTQPLGTLVSTSGRCECVSAGTEHHSETPHQAMSKVFEFIRERFGDDTPGNL